MYGWQYQGTGPGGVLMVLFMVAFWAVLVVGAVLAARYFSRARRARREGSAVSTPLEILRQRFARGEIDEEEFTRRRAVLDETK